MCNHPDLFEARPIVSAFDMPSLALQLPSLVLSGCLLQPPSPLECIDPRAWGLVLAQQQPPAVWEAREVERLQVGEEGEEGGGCVPELQVWRGGGCRLLALPHRPPPSLMHRSVTSSCTRSAPHASPTASPTISPHLLLPNCPLPPPPPCTPAQVGYLHMYALCGGGADPSSSVVAAATEDDASPLMRAAASVLAVGEGGEEPELLARLGGPAGLQQAYM